MLLCLETRHLRVLWAEEGGCDTIWPLGCLGEVLAQESLAERREALAQQIDEGHYPTLIDRILHPLGRVGGRVCFQDRPLPMWMSAFLASVFMLGAGWGLAWLLGEVSFAGPALGLLLVTTFVGAATAISAHILTELLLASVRYDILPAIERPQDFDIIDDFLRRTFHIPRQLVFVAIASPFVWAVLFYGFDLMHDVVLGGWGARLVTLFACAQGAMALYFASPVLSFLHKLGSFHLRLFPASPRDSEVIVNLQHTATEALYVFAVLFVMITIMASRLELLGDRPARLILVLMTWGPLLVVFTGAQRTFTRIITRAKYKYLRGIQQQIVDLQRVEKATTSENLTLIGELMDYHDRIRASSNSAMNLRSSLNFVNAMLLPVAAFLLANWERINLWMNRAGGGG